MKEQDCMQYLFVDKLGKYNELHTKILITIPTYNDSSHIEEMIEKLSKYMERLKEARLLVADDGSSDEIFKVLDTILPRYPWLVMSGLNVNMGRGRLLREMWSRVSADIYIYMDSDLATDLEHLPRLIESIEEGCDLVTGSRYLTKSIVRRPLLRYLVSRFYNLLINVLFHEKISDHQCGFKAFSRRAIKALLPICLDSRWFWDTEIIVLSTRFGFTISEIPVHWTEKKYHRTKLRRLIRDIAIIYPAMLRFLLRKPILIQDNVGA